MIEQILYVNLDRRPDRDAWFLENLENAGVPMERVERVPATDWRDYPDMTTLLKAIQADGFGLNVTELEPQRKGDYAFIFTEYRCLRRIISDQKWTLLMQDDVALIGWDDLQESLSMIDPHPHRTHIIQLEWRLHDRPNCCVPYAKGGCIWSHGIRGTGDKAVIYSFIGADKMLSLSQGGMGLHGVEGLLKDNFNSYPSFHPNEPQNFIKYYPHHDSDILPDFNPGMMANV